MQNVSQNITQNFWFYINIWCWFFVVFIYISWLATSSCESNFTHQFSPKWKTHIDLTCLSFLKKYQWSCTWRPHYSSCSNKYIIIEVSALRIYISLTFLNSSLKVWNFFFSVFFWLVICFIILSEVLNKISHDSLQNDKKF